MRKAAKQLNLQALCLRPDSGNDNAAQLSSHCIIYYVLLAGQSLDMDRFQQAGCAVLPGVG